MSAKRTLQIAEQIKNHLSTLLVTGQISDPRIKRTTITRVLLSGDLQQARVSYSVLGSEDEKKEVKKGLAAASGFLRRSVGEVLQLRYTPSLVFEFDGSIEHAARIATLLNQVRNDQTVQGERGESWESNDSTESSETSSSDNKVTD